MTAKLLTGLDMQLAVSQYTWEMNSQIAALAFQWRVEEDRVYELLELHYGHSVGVWQDSVDALKKLNYAQAQGVVELMCVNA